jgi:hypothetical protein
VSLIETNINYNKKHIIKKIECIKNLLECKERKNKDDKILTKLIEINSLLYEIKAFKISNTILDIPYDFEKLYDDIAFVMCNMIHVAQVYKIILNNFYISELHEVYHLKSL